MTENNDQLPKVELGEDSKNLLKSAESASNTIKDDIEDIGSVVDYSKVTLDQLAKDFHKYRKQQEFAQKENRKMIADEVARQIKPLVEQLTLLTTKNPRFVYVKQKFPLLDIGMGLYGKLIKK